MGFIFMLFMIGFIGFAGWLIVRGVQPKAVSGNENRALAELANRYARGDIDGEEYRTRKSIIEGSV
jgi:uncharacterized membrane protein